MRSNRLLPLILLWPLLPIVAHASLIEPWSNTRQNSQPPPGGFVDRLSLPPEVLPARFRPGLASSFR